MTRKIECLHWIALSLTPGFGRESFCNWRNQDVDKQDEDLEALAHSTLWNKALSIDKQCQQENISCICWGDSHYPLLLKNSRAAPPVLYVQGSLPACKHTLAMVGTRTPSWNGTAVAQALISNLHGYPVSIISGLAAGVDSTCHTAALDHNLHTIAVLAHGLDQSIYGERGALAKRILEQGGALASPFPPGTTAYKGNFLARNAIIAGLSEATLIVESREQGGALNTAEHCLADKRMLFAVPGDILRETAQGPNMLIEATEATAIWLPSQLPLLCGMDSIANSLLNKDSLSNPIIDIYYQFSGETCSIDEIAERSQLSQQEVLRQLSLFELNGQVKNRGGMIFQFAAFRKSTATRTIDS